MSLLSRLRNVFRGGKVEDEIDRELAFHLAERTDELIAQGLPRSPTHISPRAAPAASIP